MNLCERIKTIPLSWAKDARHYFENDLGEYWIAIVQDDQLLISGLDIDWKVLTLSVEDTKHELERLKQANMSPSFKGILLDEAEWMWLASVMKASLLRMEYNRRHQ